MKPNFVSNVAVAAALALVSGALLALLGASAESLRFIISVLAGAYVTWLVAGSEERVGRVTALTAWAALAALLWIVVSDLAVFVVLHIGAIWLVRSLFFHHGVLVALLDLGLVALGLGGALWAFAGTASFPAAIWTFFLIQALFVWAPKARSETASRDAPDRFLAAARSADAALRRISQRR